MRTVQITLDDELFECVDKLVKELNTSRSAFTRDALREAINRFYRDLKEKKHRQGYIAQPVNKNEFSVWENEQDRGGE
jgi:metal-responsive CopG/Arc/MetJ family transcriptional regulator